jgi:CBS domain-containing protein
MKVSEAMTPNPVCCVPSDSAQKVAHALCEGDVGSMPVVDDQQSRKLLGMITDRDLCCSVLAKGLDAKGTTIEKVISANPVVSREGDNLDSCERLMQEHQIRRIPIVDHEGRVIGIVSQADLALKAKPENVAKTVAQVSKPKSAAPSAAA